MGVEIWRVGRWVKLGGIGVEGGNKEAKKAEKGEHGREEEPEEERATVEPRYKYVIGRSTPILITNIFL